MQYHLSCTHTDAGYFVKRHRLDDDMAKCIQIKRKKNKKKMKKRQVYKERKRERER